MRNMLKSLPLSAEFVIVVVGAFGVAILSNVLALVHLLPPTVVASTPRLLGLALHDAILVAVLGSFLYLRGWTPQRIGLTFRWSDVLWGVALLAGVCVVYYGAWYGMSHLAPGLIHSPARTSLETSALSPLSVSAVVIVNPFFEELFLTGYVIAALKDVRTATFAINLSVAIRLLSHLSLGAPGVIAIIPMGLIFGYWFARTRRLWPVIGAHMLMNLAAFLYPMIR